MNHVTTAQRAWNRPVLIIYVRIAQKSFCPSLARLSKVLANREILMLRDDVTC